MRKRNLIGAIAVAVIGVAAYFLSQPRKGSVEYHKREYLESTGGPRRHWTDMGITPAFVRNFYWRQWNRRREFHRRSLVEAGYLKEVRVTVSNSFWLSACVPLDLRLNDKFTADIVALTTTRRSEEYSAVFVIAPATVVDQIAHVVREAYAKRPSN